MISNRKFCLFKITSYAIDENQSGANFTYIEMSLTDIDSEEIVNLQTYCHPARKRIVDAILNEYCEKSVPITLNFAYKIITYEKLPEIGGCI